MVVNEPMTRRKTSLRGRSRLWSRRTGCCAVVLASTTLALGAQTPGQTPATPGDTGQPAPAAVQASVPPPSPAAAQVTAVAGGGVVHGTVVAGVAGKPGGVPLPGVSVTATNTLTGRKFAAATDVDGAYTMRIPRNGRYVIRVELAGFAAATAEVLLNAADTAAANQTSNFGLQLASRVEAAEAAQGAGAGGASAGGSNGGNPSLLRSLQSLNLNAGSQTAEDASAGGGNTGAALPSLGNLGGAGAPGSDGSETVAVSGQNGQTNGLAGISEDDLRSRIQEGVAAARANGQLPPGVDPTNAIVGILGSMMGGPAGGGGRGGGGGGGFGRGSGAFRGLNPTQLHGGFNYGGEYASFDSAPWSPTLQPGTKPPYAKDNFGATLAGSPYIPGLIKPSTKQFGFLNFNFARNTTPEVLTGTVPTAAERGGDFSGLTQTVNGQPAVTPIYDPATGQPFAYNGQANVIDPARITPQALYILNHYYPLPNVPGAGTHSYNYQTVTTAGNNIANLSARFIRNLGANNNTPFGFGGGRGGGGGGNRNAPATLRQSINTSFSFSHTASDIRNIILPLSGATQSDGYNLSLGYVVGFGRFNNTSTVTWNRSNALTRNYFTNTGDDPAADAGITLPSTGAIGIQPGFYNGLPSLAIENFLSVNNTNPQDNIGQTISFSDQVSYRHKKHNMRFGTDVRRVHQDYLGGGTPLGSFTFTGYNTENPCTAGITNANCPIGATPSTTAQSPSGSAFADFLLGLPQQTQIQAGLAKIYLRENVLDWYANDDYRVANGLTINGGLRYEYFGPFSEKNGRLVNLTGVTSGTTSVGCVTPNGISVQTSAGTLTCTAGPTSSLLNADRAMYAPRFGLAYRPHFLPSLTKETVLRAGYGINFNTSQFSSFARSLSYQAPFATAENNVLSTGLNQTGCEQATVNGASNLTLANGFACSTKLYQNTYAVNPDYRLGMVQVYNADLQRTLPWGVVLNVGYNGSHGSGLNVTRAPNHTPDTVTTPNAVAFTYQDSVGESTFNALTINAQKRLQKGIQLAAKYQYAHSIDDASSFGGAASTSSIQNDADLHAERGNSSFDVRHQLTGSWLYELPVGPNRAFLSKGGAASKLLDGFSLSGTYTLASGTYFTPSYQSTAGQIAAGGTYTLRPNRDFSQPIHGAGTLQSFFNPAAFTQPTLYGSASRYSIQGPGQVLISSSLSRTVSFGETRSFEARITANNVFNTVQYNGIDTTLDSATFGQVTGAAAMRQFLFVGRFRF